MKTNPPILQDKASEQCKIKLAAWHEETRY